MSVTTFGKYELVTKLASGGMAVAYKAHLLGAKGVKKPVVLKLIHPHLAEQAEFVEMFVEEARLSATLTHSNIAQVFDFGDIDGRYFIVMELVDGQSLSHLLKRAQRKGHATLPVPLATVIAIEMCEALHYAHTRTDEDGKPLHLVHRDVSPDNVLISWQGEVKVVDFGIAKSTMSSKQTATGMVKGKYPYFSPEQSRADRTMDGRTDIYATSIVLYEMLCARRPYEGEFVEVMRDLLTGDFPLPSSLNPAVPVELEQLILKGLALDRDARFKTAREMGQQLNQLLATKYPEVHRSDVQSLMSVLFEDDLKASGRPAEIRAGFRELLEPQLATDAVDATPAEGGPKLEEPADLATGKRKVASGKHAPPKTTPPSGKRRPGASGQHQQAAHDTRLEPASTQVDDDEVEAPPAVVKMTGPQRPEASLDTPEKAAARAKFVKTVAVAAGVVCLLLVGVAVFFTLTRPAEQSLVQKTPVWATSVPPGAKVSLDGKPSGTAPMNGLLEEGTYTFGMTLDGYRPWTKRMRIAGTRQVHVEAQLVPNGADQPVEVKLPDVAKKDEKPITDVVGPDAGLVIAADVKQAVQWPLRSFSLWPQAHTLGINDYRTFTYDLEPGTQYQVSTSGSLDLGRHLGKTSALMYYLEGDKVDAEDRIGFLSNKPTTVKGATKLYAWAFDDDASDNKGKLKLVFRVSKYVPERTAELNVEDHVVVPAADDKLVLDGLLADHTYRMVFRPDAPKVMGAPPRDVLCVLATPKPKPIQKRYVFYSTKFIGTVTGVTGMECFFLAFQSTDTSGVLEVDIDDMAELDGRAKP